MRLLAATFPLLLQPGKDTEIMNEIKTENFII
jgi:hypothetical protein